MSSTVEQLKTTDDLVAIPDDGNWYELINGEIVVSEHPFLSHQNILGNLIFLFGQSPHIEKVADYWSTVGVVFDKFNSVIPDITFVRNERLGEIASGDYITGPPDLTIEIVSPGLENIRRDRELKLRTYEKFCVGEYWIVDEFQRTIQIYRLISGVLSLTKTVKDGEELTSTLLSGFSCKVEDVFAG